MLWVYGHYKYVALSVQESTLDVCRHQILTSKDGALAERVDLFIKPLVLVVITCCLLQYNMSFLKAIIFHQINVFQ